MSVDSARGGAEASVSTPVSVMNVNWVSVALAERAVECERVSDELMSL